jgi:hypothetical protein
MKSQARNITRICRGCLWISRGRQLKLLSSFRREDKTSKRWTSFKCRIFVICNNDADTTDVVVCEYAWPVGYGRELGEALQRNTVVSMLVLCVNEIVDSIEEAKHYKDNMEMRIEVCQGFTDQGFNPRYLDVYSGGATLFFRYIQTSVALRALVLREGKYPSNPVTDFICKLCVTAVARNPHLTKFQCDMKLPAVPFAYLLSTAPSLTCLCLDMSLFEGQDAQADGVIAEGLASNKTLTDIELYSMRGTNLAQAIVSRLGTHPIPTLKTFNMEGFFVQTVAAPEALPEMVRSSTALEKLALSFLSFHDDFWQSMHEALHASQSMKRLSLTDCVFDYEPTMDFMHTPLLSPLKLKAALKSDTANADIGAATSIGGWSRGGELHLTLDEMEGMFSGATWARVIAGLLIDGAAPLSMLSLNIDSDSVYEQTKSDWFFRYLAHRDLSEIHLPCLHMNYVHGKDWPFLVKCLPASAKLRELKIGNVYKHNENPINPNSFLAALRANGSLHVIAIGEDDEDDRAFMTSTQWRYARACVERNQVIATLLRSATVSPALVPHLLAAAQAAPRTAPSILFLGLLAAADADVDWSQIGRMEGKGRVKRVLLAPTNGSVHES